MFYIKVYYIRINAGENKGEQYIWIKWNGHISTDASYTSKVNICLYSCNFLHYQIILKLITCNLSIWVR